MTNPKPCDSTMQEKAKRYYRDMLEHDYPLLVQQYRNISDKYDKLLRFIKDMRYANHDAVRNILKEIGEI